MKNRIVSLFELEELLAPTTNGHGRATRQGHGHEAPASPAGATGAARRRRATCPKGAGKSTSQSFDTGASVHCQHNVPYPAVQPVDLPQAAEPERPRASAMDFQVEAFEEDDDDSMSPTTRLSTDDDTDRAQGLAVPDESEWNPPAPDADTTRAEDERSLPQSFADQMQAVESDLAELADRAVHPRPNAPSAPDGDAEAAAPPAAPARGHAIFDAMAKGMSYATEFRLPSVQLSQVFSALDRQLDAEEVQPASPAPYTSATAPTLPGGEVLLADLARLVPAGRPAGGAEDAAPRALGATIDVRHAVQLVPQQTGYSCWAAGAAMVVGWRDKISIDPSEIARATGYWAQYAAGLNAEDTQMFAVWRLTPEAAQTYTVQGFADLLRRHGPLWVASAEPGPHVRVVTGMMGDGTPNGTLLYVNDPWEAGMAQFRLPNAGAQYTESYQRFVEKQESLGRREIRQQGIYVAHA